MSKNLVNHGQSTFISKIFTETTLFGSSQKGCSLQLTFIPPGDLDLPSFLEKWFDRADQELGHELNKYQSKRT